MWIDMDSTIFNLKHGQKNKQNNYNKKELMEAKANLAMD